MPRNFDMCQEAGGRIRTISGPNDKFGLKKGEYMHLCFKDGKMHQGYVKTKGQEEEMSMHK